MDLAGLAALGGLFAAAFLAATLLPFQSEIAFAGVLLADLAPPWLAIAVASVGNTLGSVVNWWMGLFVEHFRGRRWFPFGERELDRAQAWWGRWGVWSLLLSWAPFADGLTLIAGVMRTPFWLFALVVGFAKTARYVVVWLLLPVG